MSSKATVELARLTGQLEIAIRRARDIAERADDSQNGEYLRLQDVIDDLNVQVATEKRTVSNEKDREDQREAFSRLGLPGRETTQMPNIKPPEVRFGRPLAQGQSFSDLEGVKPASIADAGTYLRAVLLDDVQMRATLTEGDNGTHASYVIPVATSAVILDLARAESVLGRARGTFIPLEAMQTKLPSHNVDPVLSARNETSAVGQTDTVFGLTTFTPRSYAGLVRVSEEAVSDSSVDMATYISGVFAAAAAVTIDQAALYSSGISPAVQGMKGYAGVTVTNAGAAGLTLTSWDPIVDAMGRLKGSNFQPTAMVTSPRVESSFAKFKGSDGQYLSRPEYLQQVPLLTSTSVPGNLTVGASGANCSDFWVADFSQIIVGVRAQLEVRVLRELFAGTGEIGVLAGLRFDVECVRPAGLQIVSGILN